MLAKRPNEEAALDPGFVKNRDLVIRGLVAAAPGVGEADLGDRLARPDEDVTFSELRVDSLELMEVCIFIELETGVAFSIGDLAALESINAVARDLAVRIKGAR